jgi:hypothetical protein
MSGGSPSGSPPPRSGGEGRRDELAAAPPFLSWRAIYAIVLGALAVEVVVFAALTAALR